MRYFNNPKTEEELKNQYRQLLIKYDYRSEKNASIIAEIKKEHDAILMQIKRANGYRTVSEKIVDGARDIHAGIVETKREEEKRVNNLKNHNYSKAEIQNLILETTKCIQKIVRSIVKKQSLDYISLRKVVKSCDTEQIARWFNTHMEHMVILALSREYNEVREKLEYALKSQSKDKKSQEAYMIQMEKMMGKQIVNAFDKYEEELVDPILVAELNVRKQEQVKGNKKFDKFQKLLFVLGWLALCAYTIFEVLTSKYMDIGEGLVYIAIYSVFFYFIYFLMVKLPRKIETSLNKKTFAGLGARKHNSRVSEKKQYQSNVAKNSLLKMVVRFLGF